MALRTDGMGEFASCCTRTPAIGNSGTTSRIGMLGTLQRQIDCAKGLVRALEDARFRPRFARYQGTLPSSCEVLLRFLVTEIPLILESA
jgi:hypothetical protein